MADEAYKESILKWRTEVDANLRRENGWLALAGLFWLRDGTNLVGSDLDCDIRLPQRAPGKLGRFEYDGSNVTMYVETGQTVEVNGVATRTALLDADQEDVPSFITLDDMRMVVIRRAQGVGIRIWDNTREARRTFPPREWYPIKEEFHIPATFTRFPTPRIVQMPDILGAMLDENMDGELAFRFAGQTLKLLVTELPDHRLYVQFNDPSNGRTTYPSGRYHYTEAHQDGKVFVDFNKAYSPPCAFTDYATCTFAPKDNHLPVAVEAGELYKGHH
jgi:uncharacterized protein